MVALPNQRLTHLLDLLDELVLQLGGQILDRADDMLLLRALHGGTEDEQQQAVHLRERPRSRRVLADGQRIGQRHDQALVQHILFRGECDGGVDQVNKKGVA